MNNNNVNMEGSKSGPVLNFEENVETLMTSVTPEIDPTRIVASDAANMSNITEREIMITTVTYTVGSSTVNYIDPWSLFLTNKRVINRINNYRCMLGRKLKVRMCVAASPFAYGRLIVAYQPFGLHDNCTKITSSFTANAITLSQKLHAEMSITDGETHVLELPFLWPDDSLDLQDDVLSELGKLIVYPLSPLAQANGSTSAITIAFFASLEGIELHRPTTVNAFNLVNQARPVIDVSDLPVPDIRIASPRDVTISCTCCGVPGWKRHIKMFKQREGLPFENHASEMKSELGTISSTMQDAAKIIDSVKSIPIVGSYAATAGAALRGGAKVAQAFGYSAPEDVRALTRNVPRPIPSLSHATGFNDFSKLTLDPTQGVDMSSKVVGYQDDIGTSITKICEKECIMSKFTWATTDTVGKCLWNARCVHNQGFWDGTTYRYSTPAEFALMMFDKVRFSNCFQLQAVASKMHRGKLLLLYDPAYIAAVELNVLSGVVLDLGESGCTCVEVSIPWSQPYPFIPNFMPSTGYNTSSYSTTAYNTKDEQSNGVFGVYVLSPLCSTNDTSGLSIEVIVKTKICSPKAFGPAIAKLSNISYINQAAEMASCDVAQDDHKYSDILTVYGGEAYDDLLAICAKPVYVYTNLHDLSNTDVTKYYTVESRCVRMAHPPARGILGNNLQALNIDFSGGTNHQNRCATAGLNFIAPAFAMCKGGVKYLACYSRRGPSAQKLTMFVGKAARGEPLEPSKAVADFSAPGVNPNWFWNSAAYQSNGAVVNNNGTFGVAEINPTLAWECAWQIPLRFRIPREVKPISNFSLYSMDTSSGYSGYRTSLSLPTTGSNTTLPNAYVSEDVYASKGDDYALYWFQGMPAWTLWST